FCGSQPFIQFLLHPSVNDFRNRFVVAPLIRDVFRHIRQLRCETKAEPSGESLAVFLPESREVFAGWLGLSLAAQLADVAEYVANEGSNDKPIAKVVHRWVEEKLYERLRPTE